MKKLLLLCLLAFTRSFAQPCPQQISSSANISHVGNGYDTHQTGMSYNAELNMLLFVAPVSPYWNYAGKSIYDVQGSWCNLSTGVWDSAIIYRDSSRNNRASLFGGGIFNPVGNTNIANAFIAASGALQDSSGKWTGCFAHAVHPAHQYIAGNDSGAYMYNTAFGSCVFLNADMQQAGNKLVVAGTLSDPNDTTKNTMRGGIIARADFSTGKAVWTVDSLLPGFYHIAAKGYVSKDFRIAFGPDGQTGYAVFSGMRNEGFYCHQVTDYETPTWSINNTTGPIVYKTENNGISWSPGSNIDWYDHGQCLQNLTDTITEISKLPAYSLLYSIYGAENGWDIVVDVNNSLHLATTVGTEPYYGTYRDSLLNAEDLFDWDYINRHPLIWDFITDGGKWSCILVDSILTGPTGIDSLQDSTAAFGAWKGKNGYLGVGANIQVSRSKDGKVLFYNWEDSDPGTTGSLLNIAPDIFIKPYDVVSG